MFVSMLKYDVYFMKSGETNNNGNIKRSIDVITKDNHRYIRKHYRGINKYGRKVNAYNDIGRYGGYVASYKNLTKEQQDEVQKQYKELLVQYAPDLNSITPKNIFYNKGNNSKTYVKQNEFSQEDSKLNFKPRSNTQIIKDRRSSKNEQGLV